MQSRSVNRRDGDSGEEADEEEKSGNQERSERVREGGECAL